MISARPFDSDIGHLSKINFLDSVVLHPSQWDRPLPDDLMPQTENWSPPTPKLRCQKRNPQLLPLPSDNDILGPVLPLLSSNYNNNKDGQVVLVPFLRVPWPVRPALSIRGDAAA